MVKIAKSLLRKSQASALNPYEALLDQRNTPTVGMITSSQRLLNRRTRTDIPMKRTLLVPNIAENVLEERANKTKKSEIYYDRNAKDLNELKPGDVIRVKPEGLVKGQEWKKGSVIKSHRHRSYAVEVDGKVLRKNRVHLKQEKQIKPTIREHKSKANTQVPAQQNTKVKPSRQVTRRARNPRSAPQRWN